MSSRSEVSELLHPPRDLGRSVAGPSTLLQHALVDQRMTARLTEACHARIARLARRASRVELLRRRVGRTIVALGWRIAGSDHAAVVRAR
jgi:hypothetical protein